ncbi:hypothetical protein Tco_0875998 [Tanacetum coccineum]|uniref:Tf2-1-like SH3-like domain-containing protein n=1 Tax=Tanacetum coccineum TaxID=301880 RepID=A0ABQ5BTY7_9ASTR
MERGFLTSASNEKGIDGGSPDSSNLKASPPMEGLHSDVNINMGNVDNLANRPKHVMGINVAPVLVSEVIRGSTGPGDYSATNAVKQCNSTALDVPKSMVAVTDTASKIAPMSFANIIKSQHVKKGNFCSLLNAEKVESFDFMLPKYVVDEVKSRHDNTLVGYFLVPKWKELPKLQTETVSSSVKAISSFRAGLLLLHLERLQSKSSDLGERLVIFREEHAPVFVLLRREAWSEELGSTYDTIRDMIILRIGRVKLRRVRAMSMTIQSSVKDKILATSSETSKVENAPAEMLRDLDQQMEKRADDGKANMVTEALSRKERVKPRHVRAMVMTIQYGMERKGDESLYFMDRIWVLLVGSVMVEAHASSYHLSIRCAPFKVLYRRKYRSPVLWVEIGESSLIGLYYADKRRKPSEFEVGDRVLLKVLPWKGVIRFGKKGKLAPRYVGPFEILERIGPVAYRLRLPEELSGVHDTFNVSNLKKCLADASLHVSLNEIKIYKTLRFVEEPVEIMEFPRE